MIFVRKYLEKSMGWGKFDTKTKTYAYEKIITFIFGNDCYVSVV